MDRKFFGVNFSKGLKITKMLISPSFFKQSSSYFQEMSLILLEQNVFYEIL